MVFKRLGLIETGLALITTYTTHNLFLTILLALAFIEGGGVRQKTTRKNYT